MLPHQICLNFDTPLIVFMIIGDGLTAISYLLIPLLIHLVLKDINRLKPQHAEAMKAYAACFFSSRYWLGTLFQSFILACGCSHVLHIIVLYQALYKIEVVVDLWTGITSIMTVILLFLVRESANQCAIGT